ncbi:hypothetical protein C2W62_04145 [Candidatus Entotheonella serta]|nr:hypothetical protein C2W62_04080 [Candidatus Entotheonella serta]PON19183.1 hypothetical protein C2W62_04145 [Candidatus Entotheonella serta]
MSFRVKIIPPIQLTERDLQRRQRRYQARAAPDTQVDVCDLPGDPAMLYTPDDLAQSDTAVFREGRATTSEQADAILVDCIFDPSVEALQAETGLPVFGPLRTTLPLVSLVASRFAVIAAMDCHCVALVDLIRHYGYGEQLASVRSLGETYPAALEAYVAAMQKQLAAARQAGAEAVVMGSTTMAVRDEIRAAAGGMPVFTTGMVTLGVMESMWRDSLLSLMASASLKGR